MKNKELISRGRSNDVFLIPNHPKFGKNVVKKTFADYLSASAYWRAGFSFVRNTIAPAMNTYPFKNYYKVQNILHIGSKTIYEDFKPGERLSIEMYNNLPIKDQAPIILGFGHFLSALHNYVPHISIAEFLNGKPTAHTIYTLDKALENMRGFLDDDLIKEVKNAKKQFLKNPETQKPCMHIFHNDLKPANVLYCAKTKTISFIDLCEAYYGIPRINDEIADFYGFSDMEQESRNRIKDVYYSSPKSKLEKIDDEVIDKFEDWETLSLSLNDFLQFPKNGNNDTMILRDQKSVFVKMGQFSRQAIWNILPHHKNYINNAINQILNQR